MGVENYYNHADFRLLSKRALYLLSRLSGKELISEGDYSFIGTSINYRRRRNQRAHGRCFQIYFEKKMLSLALDGITSFSVKPIYCIVYSGGIFILISILIGFYVLYSDFRTAEHGWASLILCMVRRWGYTDFHW